MTPLEKCLLTLKPILINTPLIRIGAKADGGYLCPDDLNGIGGCISPGASNIKHFEDQLWINWKIPSVLIDATSTEEGFNTPMLQGQTLIRKWLMPSNNEHCISMDQVIHHPIFHHCQDLLLQIDIEGSEYINLNSWTKSLLSRFRIIIIEFHCLSLLEKPWRAKSKCMIDSIAKLSETHTCVHFHPNNCCGSFRLAGSDISIPNTVECTFLRNDRVSFDNDNALNLPNILDIKNVSDKPDLVAHESWVKSSDDFLTALNKGRAARIAKGIYLEIISILRRAFLSARLHPPHSSK